MGNGFSLSACACPCQETTTWLHRMLSTWNILCDSSPLGFLLKWLRAFFFFLTTWFILKKSVWIYKTVLFSVVPSEFREYLVHWNQKICCCCFKYLLSPPPGCVLVCVWLCLCDSSCNAILCRCPQRPREGIWFPRSKASMYYRNNTQTLWKHRMPYSLLRLHSSHKKYV